MPEVKKAERKPLPSQTERLNRIERNVKLLPGKQLRNLTRSQRGGTIIFTALGRRTAAPQRPQDRIKKR